MSQRRPLSKKPAAHELEAFAEKYDTHALIHGDPVAVVFKVMGETEDEDTRLRAAEILLSYRYPRLKSLEGNVPTVPVQFIINTGTGREESTVQAKVISRE